MESHLIILKQLDIGRHTCCHLYIQIILIAFISLLVISEVLNLVN